LIEVLTLDDFFVVEVKPLGAGAFLADDDDVLLFGEIPEAAGVYQRFEDLCRNYELEFSRVIDFALDEVALAVDAKHRNRNIGIDDVLLQLFPERIGQLLRRIARRHDFADQIDRDAAVRADQMTAVELGAVVDEDRNLILRTQNIGAVVDGPTRL